MNGEQKLDVLEVLRTAFNCAKKNFWSLYALAAVIHIPLGVLGNVAGHFAGRYFFHSPPKDALKNLLLDGLFPRDISRSSATIMNFAVLLLVVLLADALTQGMIFFALIDFLRGKTPNWSECMKGTLSRAGPLVATSLLKGLGYFVGLMLCGIPLFFLIVLWAVAIPTVIAEKAPPVTALRRSSMLTKGNRWTIFGMLLLVGIAPELLTLPMIRFSVIGSLIAKTPEWIFGSAAQFIIYGSNILLQALAGVVSACVIGVLYVRLRTIKEGADVSEMSKVFE